MKLSYLNDNNILVFINNELINNIDFTNDEEIKEYFKKLFLKLKNEFRISINGFYFVRVYKDKYYGIVIELEKGDMDFYDYYIDEIDMHITLEETIFLYKINDIFINKNLIKNNNIILFNNQLYLKLNKNLNNILKGSLLEISELIYINTNEILKHGKPLNIL